MLDFQLNFLLVTFHRVTTCLENLEMSGNLTAVREISGILLKVSEVSGKKSCQRKVAENCLLLAAYLQNCFLLTAYLHPFLTLLSLVSDHALLHSYPHHLQ